MSGRDDAASSTLLKRANAQGTTRPPPSWLTGWACLNDNYARSLVKSSCQLGLWLIRAQAGGIRGWQLLRDADRLPPAF